MIDSVVLASGVQQSDSGFYIYFFRSFSSVGDYKVLTVIPCAMQ